MKVGNQMDLYGSVILRVKLTLFHEMGVRSLMHVKLGVLDETGVPGISLQMEVHGLSVNLRVLDMNHCSSIF